MAGLAALEFAQALQQLVGLFYAGSHLCALVSGPCCIAVPRKPACTASLLIAQPLPAAGGGPAGRQANYGRQCGGLGDSARRQPQRQVCRLGGWCMWVGLRSYLSV